MKPYYEHTGITIYHGDCKEILPLLTYDVPICDPPYLKSGYPQQLTDAVKLSTSAAIFGYPEELIEWCVKNSLVPSEWITWVPKNKPGNSGLPLPKCCECIAVFGATPGEALVYRDRLDCNPKRAVQRGLDPKYCRLGDVWEFKSPGLGFGEDRTERVHPNQKPLEAMAALVELCSTSNQIIIDSSCGSGTTLIASALKGRRAIGIEIEEKYCAIAAKRLEQEVFNFEGNSERKISSEGEQNGRLLGVDGLPL